MTSYILMRRLADAHPTVNSFDLVNLVSDTISNTEVRNIGRGYLRNNSKLPDDLVQLFKTSGADGFNFHQMHFKKDAQFREWVLQPNYLDLDACYTHKDLQVSYNHKK